MPEQIPEIPHRRRRGRPKVAQRLEPVMTRLAPADYDRVIQAATRREMTVAQFVRQLIILRLP